MTDHVMTLLVGWPLLGHVCELSLDDVSEAYSYSLTLIGNHTQGSHCCHFSTPFHGP